MRYLVKVFFGQISCLYGVIIPDKTSCYSRKLTPLYFSSKPNRKRLLVILNCISV